MGEGMNIPIRYRHEQMISLNKTRKRNVRDNKKKKQKQTSTNSQISALFLRWNWIEVNSKMVLKYSRKNWFDREWEGKMRSAPALNILNYKVWFYIQTYAIPLWFDDSEGGGRMWTKVCTQRNMVDGIIIPSIISRFIPRNYSDHHWFGFLSLQVLISVKCVQTHFPVECFELISFDTRFQFH